MEWNNFVDNVQRWARERGIYEYSTALMQSYKSLSEYGELADALAKGNTHSTKDGIGDVSVTVVNVAAIVGADIYRDHKFNGRTPRAMFELHEALGIMLNETSKLKGGVKDNVSEAASRAFGALAAIAHNEHLAFHDCLATAWDAIKDRKGQMVEGGVFIKEESSAEQRLAELKDEMARLEEQMEAIGAGGVTRGQRLMNRREHQQEADNE